MTMPAKPYLISDNDIVPEDIQSELAMIRSRHTMDYFRIGDIANDLLLQSAKTGLRVTAQRIHKAIGRYCGKRPRTVRYYAENAAFYSPITRDEYDMLPFSFFDFARTFNDQWRSVLEWAALHPDYSLAQLRYEYSLDKTFGHVNREEIEGVVCVHDEINPIVYDSQCAQNDLNDDSHELTELERGSIGSLDRAGGVAADYYRLIAELSYVIERARYLIDLLGDEEDAPRENLKAANVYMGALQDQIRIMADRIESAKKYRRELARSGVSVDVK